MHHSLAATQPPKLAGSAALGSLSATRQHQRNSVLGRPFLECGSLLPLWVRQLAAVAFAHVQREQAPSPKAVASYRTPKEATGELNGPGQSRRNRHVGCRTKR